MTSHSTAGLDLRGFGWHLEGLERVRELASERARSRLSAADRDRRHCEETLERMRSARERQLREQGAQPNGVIDPGMRMRLLQHLEQSLARVEAVQAQLLACQERSERARKDCLQAQQRLDAVREMREAALASFARDQRRRDAKAADLAWLARHGGGAR